MVADAFTAGILTKLAKNAEQIKRQHAAVITADRQELGRHYGAHLECSLGRDKDGFYVYTHRARSKSYPRPSAIPRDRIRFIGSTG